MLEMSDRQLNVIRVLGYHQAVDAVEQNNGINVWREWEGFCEIAFVGINCHSPAIAITAIYTLHEILQAIDSVTKNHREPLFRAEEIRSLVGSGEVGQALFWLGQFYFIVRQIQSDVHRLPNEMANKIKAEVKVLESRYQKSQAFDLVPNSTW